MREHSHQNLSLSLDLFTTLFLSLSLSLDLFIPLSLSLLICLPLSLPLSRKMVGGGVCLDRKRVSLCSWQLFKYDTSPHPMYILLPLSLSHFAPTPLFLSLSLFPLISTPPPPPSLAGQSISAESWVLDLARKQRMNTDVRRNIFCILMTSEVGL